MGSLLIPAIGAAGLGSSYLASRDQEKREQSAADTFMKMFGNQAGAAHGADNPFGLKSTAADPRSAALAALSGNPDLAKAFGPKFIEQAMTEPQNEYGTSVQIGINPETGNLEQYIVNKRTGDVRWTGAAPAPETEKFDLKANAWKSWRAANPNGSELEFERAWQTAAQKPESGPKPQFGWEFAPDGTTLVPTPGGPAARDIEAKERADQAAFDIADSGFGRISALAKEIMRDPNLPSVTGPYDAMTPTLLPASRAVEGKINTLKSQLVLSVMQAARQGSASGATGFGALSQKELALLENAVASLDLAQGPIEFKKRLNEVINYAEDLQNRLRSARREGTTAASPGQQAGAQGFSGFSARPRN